MTVQEVTVSGKQVVLTYAYLYESASFALEQAVQTNEGSFYNCLCSIVMNAFCLEAYLNHVGKERFSDWDERASPLDKLDRVARDANIAIDYGKRPFQSVRLTNKFRNSLAHGTTAILPISYSETSPAKRKVRDQKTQWEKTCTLRNAKRYLDDFEQVINLIHERYGLDWPPFGVLGTSFYVKQRKRR
ncbi:MAG: hypothetical protein U9N44_00415 [Chloroflexota bacterium]|nr:hypothetical protein [Chloroflexota bacterium]